MEDFYTHFSHYSIILLRTQFQLKCGRSVHRRDIFDVSDKRYKSFLKTLSTRNFLCEEETYRKIWESRFFGGFIPFDWLISPTICCFNALKIRLFFVKKTKKHPQIFFLFFGNLKAWRSAHSKNLGCHVFFVQNLCFRGYFWFFWRRHNLVTSTVFQHWWFNTATNKTNHILKIISFIISMPFRMILFIFKSKIITFK